MTAITEGLDGATTVLLKEPSIGGDRQICTALLTDTTAPSVLFVTYTRGPDDCVTQLEGVDAEIRNLGVVTVGDVGTAADREDVVTGTLSSAGDLTGLGIEIGQRLSEWDAPVAVCFDSLTSMLQYVDFETAYEFLHTVTGQIHATGARAHFHIDPGAHDEQHVAAITALFDASVTVDTGQIRTRDIIE
ncbi:MAG: hypothetical protein V5A39_12585 [Haloarculaceae archaeon]